MKKIFILISMIVWGIYCYSQWVPNNDDIVWQDVYDVIQENADGYVVTSCGHNGSGKVRVYTACTYDVEIGDHIVVSGTTLYNYEFSVIAISANTYFDVNYTYSGSDSNPGEWEHKILSEDDVEDNMNEDWVDPTYYTYYDDVRRFRNYGELNITLENTYQEWERVYQSLVVDENYLYCVSDFHAMVYAIEDDELTFIDDFYYVDLSYKLYNNIHLQNPIDYHYNYMIECCKNKVSIDNYINNYVQAIEHNLQLINCNLDADLLHLIQV